VWVTVLGITQTGAKWFIEVGSLVHCVGGNGGCWLLGSLRLGERAVCGGRQGRWWLLLLGRDLRQW